MKKWCLRQDKDFLAFMANVQTETHYDACAIIQKGLSQVLTVLDAFHQDDVDVADSLTFGIVLDTATNFLKLAPRAETPFPARLHSDRHRNRITNASDSKSFWDNIADAVLLENGFEEETLEASQRELIAERILKMNQGHSTIQNTKYEEFFLHCPVNDLSDGVLKALDIIMCIVTRGKKRITRYVPLPIEDIPPEAAIESKDEILKAFMTYQCGQQAHRVYKKHVKNNAKLMEMSDEFAVYISGLMARLNGASRGTDDGPMLETCLREFDTKVATFTDDECQILSERVGDRANSFLGSAMDMAFADYYNFITKFKSEAVLGVVRTDRASPECSLSFNNFKQAAYAIADSKEIMKSVWRLDEFLDLATHISEFATILPDVPRLDAGDESLSENEATRIHKVITRSEFGKISQRYPTITTLEDRLKGFFAELATDERCHKVHGFLCSGAAINLVKLQECVKNAKEAMESDTKICNMYTRDGENADIAKLKAVAAAFAPASELIPGLIGASVKLHDHRLEQQLRVLDIFSKALPPAAICAEAFERIRLDRDPSSIGATRAVFLKAMNEFTTYVAILLQVIATRTGSVRWDTAFQISESTDARHLKALDGALKSEFVLVDLKDELMGLILTIRDLHEVGILAVFVFFLIMFLVDHVYLIPRLSVSFLYIYGLPSLPPTSDLVCMCLEVCAVGL